MKAIVINEYSLWVFGFFMLIAGMILAVILFEISGKC